MQYVVQHLDIPKLYNITADDLDRDISEREILNGLKGMRNNKSPGIDGFINFSEMILKYTLQMLLIIFLCMDRCQCSRDKESYNVRQKGINPGKF